MTLGTAYPNSFNGRRYADRVVLSSRDVGLLWLAYATSGRDGTGVARRPSRSSIISSIFFTVISTLFHLYAMRRGTMLVGRGATSLATDRRALPGVIGGF